MLETPALTRKPYPVSRENPIVNTFFESLGAFCESPGKPWDGQPCDFNSSTCGGTAQDCHGRYVWMLI